MSSIKNHENIYLHIKKNTFFRLLRVILTMPILIFLIYSQYSVINNKYFINTNNLNIFETTGIVINICFCVILFAVWYVYVKHGLKKIIESIGD